MKHLLRQQFRYFFWNIPCRRSFVRSPRTIPSPEIINETLRRRIERVQDSTVSITPLLREGGNQTALAELRSIISSLHRSNRFSHALQVSEWMSDQKAYKLTSMDLESRLLLIAKVRGVEEAAKFLETVPVEKRDLYLHTALLNCCTTQGGSLSLAEITFQKMRDLGFADHNAQLFSTMLSLYHQADDHDMVVNLLREMDDQNIKPQGLSFDKLLTSYSIASVLDIQGMERFLSKWEGMIQEKWVTFFFPGLAYIQAGSKEKGLALLRRSEEPLLGAACRDSIYAGLILAYCSENLTDDVSRLWNLAKAYGISFDSSTCSRIISSFTKSGNLDEILQEWDDCPSLDLKDFGFQNRCAKEEAEKVVNMLGKKQTKWESLAHKVPNLVEDEDDKEEERMKSVAEAMEGRLHDRWNPKSSMALSAYACVQYVEGRRDIESTADILRLLNKREQVLHAMDKDRLSLKMVEAIRGGGYVGGED
ncbi:PREDICTED: pentatricopeptide repeat-containing protein At2g20710, mitochondrial isoform X2 [Camelina sativa]|uniref:Pentatricopeptide repeat-containing protein At2g20710, mitochondrial isoform X1 n=2 Tax=Camelina sativa TaxID=90675 RepID=A0ABM0W9V1_CAMSA|nr:PREDICTED: pentatricopeptide repeat-containing protein At2g20710, mitochondrial isoform X1 [Camelina sativa]XP_019092757.1 PREDICTED: pentatricopeptide repeat-containing protein At2g20710, mitochondrial isoform X2 [Camelina sativa]